MSAVRNERPVACTRGVTGPDRLLDAAPGPDALTWLRGDDGLVGWGEWARYTVTGPDRFEAAARWWQRTVDGLVHRDEVGLPGSGPVAFGSFTFDDTGAQTSVLVVPRVVLGRRDGVTWQTTIGSAPAVTRVRPVGPAPVAGGARVADPDLDSWRAAVAEVVRRVRTGSLAKAVLALDLPVELATAPDPRRLAAELTADYPSCWTFSVDGLVGATPELLLRRTGDRIASRVLAGTVGRGSDEGSDRAQLAGLLRSAKDRGEHEHAVTSVLAALQPYCPDVRAAEPAVLELANVAHLATDVTGRLVEEVPALSLLGALHPTAAVAGTPTGAALAAIRELEATDRGRYAAPVGWVDSRGDGEWCLALRCAELRGRQARLFAGCGIVEGSDPAEEVAEWVAKLAPMRSALRLDDAPGVARARAD